MQLAALQPEAKSTKIPSETHRLLLNKTRPYGGLYVYRDGIRVLPYGDVDYDWLEIEKRRTKSAAYYYFSHRNIFGAILLDGRENARLSEKAGREGFRENAAYRNLRSILQNFFVQVAGDFFREEGAYSDAFHDTRAKLQGAYAQLRKRELRAGIQRKKFVSALDRFFEAYDEERPHNEATALADDLERELKAGKVSDNPELEVKRLLRAEARGRQALRRLEENYEVIRPRGIGIPQTIERKYERYVGLRADLKENVFRTVRRIVEDDIAGAAARAGVELDNRRRIEQAVEELATETRRVVKSERRDTSAKIDEVGSLLREAARTTLQNVERVIAQTNMQLERASIETMNPDEYAGFREELENRLTEARANGSEFFAKMKGRVEELSQDVEGGGLSTLEAVETRNQELEARASYDIELAQLGLAVGVINHEFDASVRAIRNNLRRLKTWADTNEGLNEVYGGLRSNFDHLDAYLALFTPFHRRLNRKRIDITGAEIARYVRDLFGPRFERHRVEFSVADSFLSWRVFGFPSSFYPVFVNMIDNAVFWLDRQSNRRQILLEAVGPAAYISNDGPPIAKRHRQVIFEQGSTFKPGGRGLGLFIATEALKSSGYTVAVSEPPRLGMRVSFVLSPMNATDTDDEDE